jgi:pyruvate dehydrogenase E2 component (dihydrolipoamide acetyltransferase)
VPAAPVVRKLARELGVDIHQVPATGPGGRVLREDVERFAKGERPAHTTGGDGVGVPAVAGIEVELPDFSQHGPIRREPVPQIRKTIARQMVAGVAERAARHAHRYRRRHRPGAQPQGVQPEPARGGSRS